MTTIETSLDFDRTDVVVVPDLQIQEMFDPTLGIHELVCGDKMLEVMIAEDNIAGTLVNTLEGRTKVDGATTALYVRTGQILQETADRIGKPLTYYFATANPSMRRWAKASGEDLFKWSVLEDSEEEFIAQAIFSPSSSL